MSIKPALLLLLILLTAFTSTSCEHDLLYFGTQGTGIYRLPVKGGSPNVFAPEPSPIMGLAYSPSRRQIFTAQQGAITFWNTEKPGDGLIIRTGIANCIALDEPSARIFWGDQARHHVASCDLNGNDLRVLVERIDYPEAIAVNSNRRLLYWIQDSPERGVWMAQLDGSGKRRISAEPLTLAALSLDPDSGRIFWVRQNILDQPASIVTANFDGANPEVIVRVPEVFMEGLTVDRKNRRVIWIERVGAGSPPARIRSANFDGSSPKTLWQFRSGEAARSITIAESAN